MDEGLCSAAKDILERIEGGKANIDDYMALTYIVATLSKKYVESLPIKEA